MVGKILHIVSGDLWAGAEAQVLFQLEALSKRGIDVEILLFNSGVAANTYTSAGLRCTIAEEELGFFQLLYKSISYVKGTKPKIIVTHGYKENVIGFLLAMYTGARLVTTFHGRTENYSGLKWLKMVGYQAIHRLICKYYSCRIITVSHRLAADLGFQNNPKSQVVWNVINCQKPNTQESTILPKHPAILFVGRLVNVKRCDLAIRAFKDLVNQGFNGNLYIVGDGELKNELQSLTETLQLENRISFLGFRYDVKELIASCDLFLITSDSEGIPTVLLEAIFACRPIVTTRVGGIEEVANVFTDYPITLVEPNNHFALSNAMMSNLNNCPSAIDQEQIQKLFSKHFSAQHAASQLEQIYLNLTK